MSKGQPTSTLSRSFDQKKKMNSSINCFVISYLVKCITDSISPVFQEHLLISLFPPAARFQPVLVNGQDSSNISLFWEGQAEQEGRYIYYWCQGTSVSGHIPLCQVSFYTFRLNLGFLLEKASMYFSNPDVNVCDVEQSL